MIDIDAPPRIVPIPGIALTALAPIRARRAELEQHPETVEHVLEHGNARAREEAERTMGDVREAMKLNA